MKNTVLSAVLAVGVLTGCSTVSSILQNTFPYNATVLVTSGSPANTTLSAVSPAQSVNQLTGSGANVKDIRVSNATLTVNSNTSVSLFQSVKVYLSNGSGNEILVASRDNIPDNVGSSLSLDVNTSGTLDKVMKSGSVQQRMVYVLKKSPTSDVTVKTSIGFNSVPVNTN